jgi:hypothetical protein
LPVISSGEKLARTSELREAPVQKFRLLAKSH